MIRTVYICTRRSCGLFTGASCARLVRGPVRTGPDRKTRRKGISALVPLYLSVVLLAALGGFFFGGGYPGPSAFIPFGIIALLVFLAALFRRAAGIPIFLLFAALLLLIGFTLKDFTCVPSGEELASLRVLADQEGSWKLELDTRGESSRVVETEDPQITFRAHVLIVHPAWFFIRKADFVTDLGIGGGSIEEPPGLGNILLALPGFSMERYVSDSIPLHLFAVRTLSYHRGKGFVVRSNDR